MNSPPLKYASLAMSTSPAYSNILQLSHFDRLINFLEAYPAIIVATPALFLSAFNALHHFMCSSIKSIPN